MRAGSEQIQDMHACMHACIVYMHTCINTYKYIYVCVYTHYIYTYIDKIIVKELLHATSALQKT